MIAPTLAGTRPLRPPKPAHLLDRFPCLQRFPARLLGFGIHPELVKTRAA